MNLQKGLSTLKRIISQRIPNKNDTFQFNQVFSDNSHKTTPNNLRIESLIKCKKQKNIDQQFSQFIQSQTAQINQLRLQSQIKEKQQFADLPLQCNESRLQLKKLKVHSSIDGKEMTLNNVSQSSKSIPLSDLILTDNGYEHLFSNRHATNFNFNRHQNYQSQLQTLQSLYKENCKCLKQQTQQYLKIIEEALYIQNIQDNTTFLNRRIQELQQNIQKLKNQKKVNEIFKPKNIIKRQSTPDIKKVRSFKLLQSPIAISKNQQLIKSRLNQQRQRSLKLQTKLLQVKNHQKVLQNKLSIKEDYTMSNQKSSQVPLSPRYRKNIQKNLQIQKINYLQTLKRKKELMKESMKTFKSFTQTRYSQLVQQIKVLKKENNYLESKISQDGYYYCSSKNKINNLNLFRDQSKYKNSIFSINNSQKLIAVSSTKSIYPWKQSPRSPQPRSPQTIYIKAVNKQHLNEFIRSSKSKRTNSKQFSVNSSRSKGRRAFLMRDMNINNQQNKTQKCKKDFRQLLECIKNQIKTQPSDQYYMSQNEYRC